MSVSGMAIIPMQDLLGLGESAKMNTPGTSEGNWRLLASQLRLERVEEPKQVNIRYGRWKKEAVEKENNPKTKNNTFMELNQCQKLLEGAWEMENEGPVIELSSNGKMKRKSKDGSTDSGTYILEEEEGMVLLTIPSVIERSEVMNVSPTELVIKEFEPGSSAHAVRTFKKLEKD